MSDGGPSLTRQELNSEAQSHVTNGRCHRLADTAAVSLGTLPEPSQGDQGVDLDCAQGCGVERHTGALAGFVAGLALALARSFAFFPNRHVRMYITSTHEVTRNAPLAGQTVRGCLQRSGFGRELPLGGEPTTRMTLANLSCVNRCLLKSMLR